jgi:hypothetical protein
MQFPPAAKQAGDAAYRNCVAHWTGIPPHAFHGTDYCADEAQQAAKEAEDAAEREQERTQAAQRQASVNERLTSLGYRVITVADFLLDAKELAASEARIAVSGYYFFYSENAEYLQSSPVLFAGGDIIQNPADGMLLITADAKREARAAFLKCRQGGLGSITGAGCPVSIVGHAGACEMVMTGLSRPCLNVDDLTENVLRAAAVSSEPEPKYKAGTAIIDEIGREMHER